MFPLLLIIRQYFLAINFIAFNFTILPELNSKPNNLVEVLFISFLVDCLMCLNISLIVLEVLFISFLVDCLMCLNISLIALKLTKSPSSGSILINLQLKFLFYFDLSFNFEVNISIAISGFINFYCKLMDSSIT